MLKTNLRLLGLVAVAVIGVLLGQFIFGLMPQSAATGLNGPAPEVHSDTWINSGPVSRTDMQGHVTIVEFWTFMCQNCQDAMAGLKKVYAQYKDKGLIVIGVHSPELAPERDVLNVRQAVIDQGVTWPVALDNDFKNWNAYKNAYWPAFYLIDKHGNLRYLLVGEGHDDELLSQAGKLLAEK